MGCAGDRPLHGLYGTLKLDLRLSYVRAFVGGLRRNTVARQGLFQSGWFVEGLLSQTLIIHLIRTRRIPFIQSTATVPVLVLTGLVMAIGVAIPFSPLGTRMGMQPLPWSYFPCLVGILLAYCVLTQWVKSWYVRRFQQWF